MFCPKKNFGPKKNVSSKKNVWSQKYFGPTKILGLKKMFGPKEFLVEHWFLGPLGNRVKLGAYCVRGGGINFLALDKSTYQILASY